MEEPLINKKWKKGIHKLDIIFPNLYSGGAYNFALMLFYNIVNNLENWICKRVFLDKGKIDAPIVGFTLQYELDYKNVLLMLKRNNIPLNKSREEIIFAGGPCVTNNPKTMGDYFDFLFLGEIEETLTKILKIYEKCKDKEKFLEAIKDIKGVYVPDKTKKIEVAVVKDLNKVTYPIYQPLPIQPEKELVFGKPIILEIERGCPYNCKFCILPSQKYGSRIRSFEKIKDILEKCIHVNKRKKVVIFSPSFMHKDRKKILRYILKKGLTFSVPAIRIESLDEELLGLISKGGQKTLTLAPEANFRLRKFLNKNTTDEAFFKVINWANKYKIFTLKYYFLLGIPNQTQKDLEETINLIKKLIQKFNGKTYISINPLVAKPKTQLQGFKFDKRKIKKQAKFFKKELTKLRVRFKISAVSTSEKEYILAYQKKFIPPLQ
ncbi:MAG: radical SAM protein [Nanoarchaeota archaeon]|nr:radical SAM protein [Nanoarchaeota archaeon]